MKAHEIKRILDSYKTADIVHICKKCRNMYLLKASADICCDGEVEEFKMVEVK